MKKFIKNNILGFIFGLVVAGGIGVIAYSYNAKDINYTPSDSSWNVNTVGDAIDSLKVGAVNKFCELKTGNALEIGSMYECDPGDSIKRNFYVLEVRKDSVDLLMDRNITQGTSTTTMSWNNAMKYIDNNNLKTKWKNVAKVDLPSAQQIVNATGRTNWYAADSGSTWWCFASKGQDSQSAPYCNTEQAKAYNWLYDYTRECNGCTHSLASTEAYGYWTRDLVSNTAYAWRVDRYGDFDDFTVSNTTYYGVRPVITILKSNIK